MSQFSESYHLRGNNTEEATELIKKTAKPGYVGKLSDGWMTLIPESAVCGFKYDEALVAHNTGILLHYVHPEDHGFLFRLFEGDRLVSEYVIDINENDFITGRTADNLNSTKFVELTGIALSPGEFDELMQPKTWDEYFDLPGKFMELLGIPPQAYEWVSYHYCELSKANNPDTVQHFVEV